MSALWASYGRAFMGAGFLKLFQDAMLFTGPLILRWLLAYLANPGVGTGMGGSVAGVDGAA